MALTYTPPPAAVVNGTDYVAIYTSQRNQAGDAWNWDYSLGFPVPNVALGMAVTWVSYWISTANDFIDAHGTNYRIDDLFAARDKLQAASDDPTFYYQDQTGMLTSPETFWKRVWEIASTMNALQGIPTTLQLYGQILSQTMTDTAEGIADLLKKGAGAVSNAAAGIGFAVLVPFIPYILVGIGGYVLYKYEIKNRRGKEI